MRNDAFDAKNYFSEDVEPLKQHQSGVTAGGPLRAIGRSSSATTKASATSRGSRRRATVPTAAERNGDFSAMGTPLINFAAGGVPIPGNQIPPGAINPVSRNVLNLYPLGNVSPSIYRETLVTINRTTRRVRGLTSTRPDQSQLFARYSYSGGHNINPISVRGSDVPGFPTRDDIGDARGDLVGDAHAVVRADQQRCAVNYLRHRFFFDQRLNRTPPARSRVRLRAREQRGTGAAVLQRQRLHADRRCDHRSATVDTETYELRDGLAWARGAHLVKVGGEFQHTGIDMFQAIAPNAFFVFASTFPTNNAVANLLLGAPVTFYQGFGDFNRGIRAWGAGTYAQDEWRVGRP